MSEHLKTEIVVGGIITAEGEILLARKPEEQDHPIAGDLHFPGGHMEGDEKPEETLKREIIEEAGLEIEIHHLVDCYRIPTGKLRIIFHAQADSQDAEPLDGVSELKWVKPENLEEELEGHRELEDIRENPRIENMVEKLQKMPVWNR